MLKTDICKLAVFVLVFILSGCGTNPVTHKRELQLVSESQEISIGQENYAPARQQQGGDYTLDPELTAYVRSVGNKLAAVSDRQLPYEFVVLNDSVPNAWSLPGGKIAFNRGLLYELNSEAELAAVLGHEIVHAAARHGAQKMETGMLLQGAVMAAGVAAQDKSYANLIVGGAQLSSQLIATKFSRDEESEADLYGMRYMKRAGYDPTAAVTLQETFVRLSKDRSSSFIEGLFASHPPSEARVAANKATLAELGAGGVMGTEIYAQKVARLKATEAAYKAYDDGVKALARGDVGQAAALAKQAVAGEPREARFRELQGDIAMKQNRAEEALGDYQRAIDLQPDYFRPYVQKGAALASLGRRAEAEPYLKRSNELLPTATSFYLLGQLAEARGDVDTAWRNTGLPPIPIPMWANYPSRATSVSIWRAIRANIWRPLPRRTTRAMCLPWYPTRPARPLPMSMCGWCAWMRQPAGPTRRATRCWSHRASTPNSAPGSSSRACAHRQRRS